ncbi:MAG: phage virion morphogenesis protein [Bacteroidetes bacterium]|nr:phage virion morphogenesis protein [Bacteroidota bacterium]
MTFTLSGINELYVEMQRRTKDISPVAPVIAVIIQKSIAQNFRAGGRTDGSGSGRVDSGGNVQWVRLKAATVKRRAMRGRTADAILQDTRGLANSIIVRPSGSSITISSNKTYARIQHFGGDINHPGGTPYMRLGNGKVAFLKKGDPRADGTTKPHKITIPARPYLVTQAEDLQRIGEVIGKHIAK